MQGSASGKYEVVEDISSLLRVLEDFLSDYNSQHKAQMPLALFRYVAEHICRIARILGQPGGHALLVGVGGSGRSSLTRLAAFICELAVVTVDGGQRYGLPEWREDVKMVMRQCGALGQRIVFLLSDSQLALNRSFLEDVNSMLNTGEVCANINSQPYISSCVSAVTQPYCMHIA